MAQPIVLLHMSDLHFGPNSRFDGLNHKDLGQYLAQAIQAEAECRNLKAKPDLVIVTGDVAQAAKPKEYGSPPN